MKTFSEFLQEETSNNKRKPDSKESRGKRIKRKVKSGARKLKSGAKKAAKAGAIVGAATVARAVTRKSDED